MHWSRRYFFLLFAFLIVFSHFISALAAHGQSSAPSTQVTAQDATGPVMPLEWTNRVGTLAGQIAEAVRPSKAISLEVQNISSLGAADVEMIRHGLQQELSRRGIRIEAEGLDVKVTLAENTDKYVWVSQTRRGEKQESTPQVAIVSVARSYPSAFAQKLTPTLQRKVVDERREPILDFALTTADEGYVAGVTKVFGPGFLDVTSFTFDAAGENKIQLAPLSVVPRDLRGLVSANKYGEVSLYAANDACVVTGTQHTCGRNSNQDWPFPYGVTGHFVGNRNYFSGFVGGAQGRLNERAFYSAAIGDFPDAVNGNRLHPIVVTELDGKARYFGQGDASHATFSGWGDEIASINRSCDRRWFVLVTGTGDFTQADRIQTYEMLFGQDSWTAKAEGQPLEFAGPIVSMWPSDDEMSARVVSKNLQTGMYEASVVTVSCSQ